MPSSPLKAAQLPADPAKTLDILSVAIGKRVVPAPDRVMASSNSCSPDEGLALLTAYAAIQDKTVRQALLDTIIAIAGTSGGQT